MRIIHIRYHYTLNGFTYLGRLVATISIAATYMRLVISLGIHYSTRNYRAVNKEIRSMQFASKMIFEEKAVLKTKADKFIIHENLFHKNYKF